MVPESTVVPVRENGLKASWFPSIYQHETQILVECRCGHGRASGVALSQLT
jgi:hypothetical protein